MLAATPQISAVVLNKFFISVRVESQRMLWKKSELQVKRFNHTWIYARENCSILNISYFRVCSHFSIIAFVAIHDKTNLLAVTPENSLHKFADVEHSASHTCQSYLLTSINAPSFTGQFPIFVSVDVSSTVPARPTDVEQSTLYTSVHRLLPCPLFPNSSSSLK